MPDFFLKLARELYGANHSAAAPYLARSLFYRKLREIENEQAKEHLKWLHEQRDKFIKYNHMEYNQPMLRDGSLDGKCPYH
jgi:hypothetical protein